MKFLFGEGWRPKENILYRSWEKTPSIRAAGREFEVSVAVKPGLFKAKKKFSGAFKVVGKTCIIILFPKEYYLYGRRKARKFSECMLKKSVTFEVPTEGVKFKKINKYYDTIAKYGQSGEAGKVTHYEVILKKIPDDVISKLGEIRDLFCGTGPITEGEPGECRECVTRRRDHSTKEVDQCPHCGVSFCVEHLKPKITYKRNYQKYPEDYYVIEDERRKGDVHRRTGIVFVEGISISSPGGKLPKIEGDEGHPCPDWSQKRRRW